MEISYYIRARQVIEKMVELVGIEPTTSSLRTMMPTMPSYFNSTTCGRTNQKNTMFFKTYVRRGYKTHAGVRSF
jgi:hypothetical protein